MKYEIIFYEDKNGNSLVLDYLKKLANKKDKNSRINHNKIFEYMGLLEKQGKELGAPYIKHLEGEIWELRPIRNRLLFATLIGNTIIILNYFIKKTQKTPKKEIKIAKRRRTEWIEREKGEGRQT